MKPFLVAAALASSLIGVPAFAADVGLSISIGQPGFYGRIELGDFPQPRVIYNQPVIIEQGRDNRSPIYLRVPLNHRKHWNRYCRQYNACGEQVYFVEDNWYNNEYVPQYQQQHRQYRPEEQHEQREMRGGELRGEQHDMRRNEQRGEQHEMREGEQRGDDHRGDDHRGDDQNHGRDH